MNQSKDLERFVNQPEDLEQFANQSEDLAKFVRFRSEYLEQFVQRREQETVPELSVRRER